MGCLGKECTVGQESQEGTYNVKKSSVNIVPLHLLYLLYLPYLPYLPLIELQRKLLGDKIRNDAFYGALQKVIKRGKTTVLDLGSGTGFLSFLASRLGAKHCTLIESGEIGSLAPLLAKRNKITHCTFITAHSTDVPVSEKVDVLVSETLGNYALEENIIESIEDGKRFLKDGGVIIPGKITQFACPIVSDRVQKDIDIWDTGYELDLRETREISLNNMYVKTLKKEDLLAEKNAIRAFDQIDFSKKNLSLRKAKETWVCAKPMTIFGFGLWWEAELVPGITLSTSPLEKPTHWEQIYLPLLESVSLQSGESIEFSLVSDTTYEVKVNLIWTVKKLDAKGKVMSQQMLDMRKGYVA